MTEAFFDALAAFEQVEALVLGGSRASGNADRLSDYDIYVYCTDRIPENERTDLLSQYCSRFEVGNSYFEYEDNCILKNGIKVDVIYRELDKFSSFAAYVAEQHHAFNGYTTCFWHNIITSRILYDKNGRFAEAQKKLNVDYPEELRQNIIKRNLQLLCDGMPAYKPQILRAIERNDIVSINHRTTVFMESYFDIIFALNRKTHPGEKMLVEICKNNCSLLPENFEENINRLFKELYTCTENTERNLDALIIKLKELLAREKLIG